MTHHFDVIIERDEEGYFIASVPSLPGCHTQANRSMYSCSASVKRSSFAWKLKARCLSRVFDSSLAQQYCAAARKRAF